MKGAELLWSYVDVEPIAFNKGFYTVDVKYFYKITAEAYCGLSRPKEICGLATYDKRTVLFGSEGSVRIFSSQYLPKESDLQNFEKTNLPIGVVEVVDPVALGIKVTESCGCGDCGLNDIPDCICRCFEDDIVICDEGKKLFVTLGQFSIIKLERDVQLLMPAYDICMPERIAPAAAAATIPAICSRNSSSPWMSSSPRNIPIISRKTAATAKMAAVKAANAAKASGFGKNMTRTQAPGLMAGGFRLSKNRCSEKKPFALP